MVVPIQIEENITEITRLLRCAFATVAMDMGLTMENFPNHVAFITEAKVLQQLATADSYCFGIREAGELVGFVAVAPYDSTHEITRLAVAPEHRHKGYGRLLVDAACEQARRLGLTSIGLGIVDENAVLKEWYVSQGFVAGEPFTIGSNPFTVCGLSKELGCR